MVRLVEAFFDQVDNRLALLFRKDRFWETGIKQARDSHRVMRLLMVWWEETTKVNVISKVGCVVLVIRIRITTENQYQKKSLEGKELTWHNLLPDQSAWEKNCRFVDH